MAEIFVATQEYPWNQRYSRWNNWPSGYSQALAEAAAAGLQGWEPALRSEEDLHRVAAQLHAHGLELRSFYAGGPLHDERRWATVTMIEGLARAARPYGAFTVVVNPDPIAWNGTEVKSDLALAQQAEALQELGRRLAEAGQTLAYHMHDAEFRAGAREFHHMLCATQPQYVRLCLDAHWIYRATCDSQLALFDIIQLYGARISTLHLRQSQNGIWSETFGAGDIDYARVAAALRELGVNPLLVIEQACEPGTPETMPVVAAYQHSLAYVRKLFAG